MKTTTTPSTSERLDLRLARLELEFGTSLAATGTNTSHGQVASGTDALSRIDALIRSKTERRPPAPPSARVSDATTESKRVALHEDFRTVDRLLSELAISPLAGPTASGGSANAPLIFRRMEVLASSESMKRDMELLARIRDLTNIGTKTTEKGSDSESKVANCPVVSSDKFNLSSDPEALERLEKLCFRIANISKRSATVSQRADEMLSTYSEVMRALSEKIVLAEEQLKG